MSDSIETLYQNVLLASAAYVDWIQSEGESDIDFSARIRAVLVEDSDFTSEQALRFFRRYTPIRHRPNTDSGFAATLFLDEVTGKKVLAIRGTEIGIDDLFEDFQLAFTDGSAIDQYIDLRIFLGELINSGDIDIATPITVSGHSLGGHLATLLTIDPDWSDLIDHAYTYNGPGLGAVGIGAAFIEALERVVESLGFGDFTIPSDRITNLYSTAGLSFPAGLGAVVGDTLPIFTEDQGGTLFGFGDFRNHYIKHLVDSLSVYRIIDKLSTTITLSEIHDILSSTSNEPIGTLNTFLAKLGDIFTIITTLRSTETTDEFLADLENRLDSLLIPIGSVNVHSLLGNSAQNISQLASLDTSNGLAYRHALRELNSFLVEGPTEQDTLAIYENSNLNQELDINNFSEQYLADRSRFLELTLTLANEDLNHEERPKLFELYEDKPTQFVIDNRPDSFFFPPNISRRFVFGGDDADIGENALEGSDSIDHIYGGFGDDELIGGASADRLEGGRGDDVLRGGGGTQASSEDNASDELLGGGGFDTYFVGAGDVIQDPDGGVIKQNGTDLSVSNITLASVSSEVFTNNDNNDPVRFRLLADSTLQVLGSFFTIRNFNDGDFGISLDGSLAPPELNLINGTESDDKTGAGNGPIQGTIGTDEIHGLGGDDDIDGAGGNDVVFGEAGDDFIITEDGHDIVEGGAGRDVLISTAGKDVLLGGSGENFLSGGDDDDFLEGGELGDFLAGGAGTDALQGGAGDDVLFGDGTHVALNRTWQVTITDSLPNAPGGVTINVTGVLGDETSADDQADILNGGAGNDHLFGGGGNDQLFGEEGTDNLEGGAGNDRLSGGAGADELRGDRSSDRSIVGNDTLDGGVGNDFLEGGFGNDILLGGNGDDEIHGDYLDTLTVGGDDQIEGGTGSDVIVAGAGNDIVQGGDGADQIDGGEGADFISGDNDSDSIAGGSGDDVLVGGFGDDIVTGGGGNDVIQGDEGLDQLFGDDGLDEIDGGAGNDQLSGGADADTLRGGGGNDLLDGGDDADVLFGDDGDDQLQGGAGNDTLDGGTGNDALIGQDGDDTLQGGFGDDNLWGNDGNDLINGDGGNDFLFGEDGADVLSGGAGLDDIRGGNDNDIISGGADRDLLFGDAGDDSLDGGDGDDNLQGGFGNDSLSGGDGVDALFGEDGIDFLNGGAGDDQLQGGTGVDTLSGDAGDDTLFGDADIDSLHGGIGNDALFGGGGNDVYLFNVGDEQDLIFEQGDTANDSINFGDGITAANLLLNESLNDLVITHTLDSRDELRVHNWFGEVNFQIGRIEFADGVVWDKATIDANINFAPVAVSDALSTNEDTALSISPETLLANDTDGNNDILTITNVSNPSNGSVALDADGNIAFTPNLDFFGIESFEYTISDGRGGFSQGNVQVDILPVNDAPVAAPDIAELILSPTTTLPPITDPILVAGPEFLANANTVDAQNTPKITALPGGQFVVIWTTFDPEAGDPDRSGVAARVFDNNGAILGAEFLVNEQTVNFQDSSDVTGLSNGNIVFVWESYDRSLGDTSETHVSARLYDPSQNIFGSEFRVNAFTRGAQRRPSVAALTNGNFVITWETRDPDTGDASGIAGRLFDNNGVALSDEFLINTNLSGFQLLLGDPVSALPGGGFVVTWQGDDPNTGDLSSLGISAQIFDENGAKFGDEFLVNTNTEFAQVFSSVTTLSNGNFVIVWSSDDPAIGDSDRGIVGQIFKADGVKVGGEFLINTQTLGLQNGPTISQTNDGGFVVVWRTTNVPGLGDADGDIAAQRFDASGIRVGEEFLVNVNTLNDQNVPRIEGLSNGGFAITWHTKDPNSGDADGGVAVRTFNFETPIGGANSINIDVLANDTDVDDVSGGFTLDEVSVRGGLGRADIFGNQLIFDAGSDFENLADGDSTTVTVDYTMSDDDGAPSSSTATITLIGANDAPFVQFPIGDISTDEDAPFNFSVPLITFKDPDNGDSLSLSASLENGNPLPQSHWLSFDPVTRIFNGIPENSDVGKVSISILATDTFGESAASSFTLTVNNTNDVPVVQNPIVNQITNENEPFLLTIAADTFLDIDVGDSLSLSAELSGVGTLPLWLSFDPGTGTFNGTPSGSDIGTISIDLIATDLQGTSVASTFELVINGIPVTKTEEFLTYEETAITILASKLLVNDVDPDGDPLSVIQVGNPIGGNVGLNDDGDVLFMPEKGFNGVAKFDYTASDGKIGLATQSVNVRVLNPVIGDSGNNILDGSGGDDFIDGGAGDDTLNGQAGNDILTGGVGNDTLVGGIGDDSYLFGPGDGVDIIQENGTAGGGDRLVFTGGLSQADVIIERIRKDLVFSLKGSSDSIILEDWKSKGKVYPINVEFGDGVVLDAIDLNVTQRFGRASGSTVRGSKNADRLYGDVGNDTLIGKTGDDTLDGGAGIDLLDGGEGNDTYLFTSGWEIDSIIENDPTPGNTDTIGFGSGITPLDLVLQQTGNDLLLSERGAGDSVTVQDWYVEPAHQVEQVRTSDGSLLLNTQVDRLIQAMATFTADTGLSWEEGITQLPEDVETILAAHWQS